MLGKNSEASTFLPMCESLVLIMTCLSYELCGVLRGTGRTTGKYWVLYVERHIWFSISCCNTFSTATNKALASMWL